MGEGGKKTDTKVLIAGVKPEFYADSVRIAAEFRISGIAAETDLNERNLRKQFDYANALSIPYIAVVGERELKSGMVTLRDMVSGNEELMKIGEAIIRLKELKS
jgi:histidyl-tRNA synthetase